MYEIYCQLRDQNGVKDADVASVTGITKSTFSDWKNGRSKPKNEKLQKIADYFGVTVDYLMTGKGETEKKEIAHATREPRDIANDLIRLLEKLTCDEEGNTKFRGNTISEETQELFAHQIDAMLNHLNKINKEK